MAVRRWGEVPMVAAEQKNGIVVAIKSCRH
jgi:hypothetical protein